MKTLYLYLALILVPLSTRSETDEIRIPNFKSDDRIYTNARITKITDAYAIVMFEGGGKRVKLEDLPEPFKSKYYNPEKAAKFLDEEKRKKSDIAASLAKAQTAAQTALLQKQINENRGAPTSLATAFGVHLGQKFLPGMATAKREGSSEGQLPMYGFKPKQPVAGFSEYWVMITPQSSLVWKIFASGKFDNGKSSKFETGLLAALEEKYGKSTHSRKHVITNFDYDSNAITKDDLEIVLNSFSGESLGNGVWEQDTITLSYEDKSLEKNAKKEAGGKDLEELKKGL